MKRIFLLLLLFLKTALIAADYDCIMVGTSPHMLFEALYQSAIGKKVLVLESASQIGGAWQTIDMCGVAHVDFGCHHIGNDQRIADFLKNYIGCRIVSLADPSLEFQANRAPNGLYFSQGCYELIRNLEILIKQSGIKLELNCSLENVLFENDWALCQQSNGVTHRTKKIYYTNASSFSIEDSAPPSQSSKYYHLYLLISDAGPIRFSYRGGFSNVSRIMNLTPFVGLAPNHLQLIILQVRSEEKLHLSEELLQELKKAKLIDDHAQLIKEESAIYEQKICNPLLRNLPESKKIFFERIETSHFNSMRSHFERWKTALPLFK